MYRLDKKESFNSDIPAYCFVSDHNKVEDTTIREAKNITELPIAKKNTAFMPDFHATGDSMPVGGVLATEGLVMPDLISNDIGCGVLFVDTGIPSDFLDKKINNLTLGEIIADEIDKAIPTGIQHVEPEENYDNEELRILVEDVQDEVRPPGGIFEPNPYQMGKAIDQAFEVISTLGGGNHFIEIQEDVGSNTLGIMIHSGSRSVGAIVNKHFSNLAKELNENWGINLINPNITVPYLPIHSDPGRKYLAWMNFALSVAKLNRKTIYEKVKEIITTLVDCTEYEYEEKMKIDMHHNYGDYENIDGTNYFVHRKGAIRARKSDIVPIPGAMGSYSYIAKGLGNKESFHSAPHGAGRKMTRTEASKKFSNSEVKKELTDEDVIIRSSSENISDEYKGAYKNIEDVIDDSSNLVEPIKKMKTKIVIKG